MYITSLQYYLNESSIGKSRAEASVPRLSELNSYVRVSAVTEATLTDDVLKAHHVCCSDCVSRKVEFTWFAGCGVLRPIAEALGAVSLQ